MIPAFIILLVMAIILYYIAWRKRDGRHIKGIKGGFMNLKRMIPLLIAAFILAGILPQAVSTSVIKNLLGKEAGIRGIIVGSFTGALIPGGPYVAFPIISSIYKAGASLATAVAFVTSWATCSFNLIAFEIPFVGPKFTLMRYSIVVFLPFLAGFLTYILFV